MLRTFLDVSKSPMCLYFTLRISGILSLVDGLYTLSIFKDFDGQGQIVIDISYEYPLCPNYAIFYTHI